MSRFYLIFPGAISIFLAALMTSCSQVFPQEFSDNSQVTAAPEAGQCSSDDPFKYGVQKALIASQLGGSARTVKDWNQVVLNWIQAIEGMQSVPISSPKRAFAQKKVAEYLQKLEIARTQATQTSSPLSFTSFNHPFFDEKLTLFLSYSAALGAPDILIVGSSRAVQGVDPQKLQASLATQNSSGLKVFNLGVNGATAQVVDLMIRQILTSEQSPKLIIWADGVRALNSGRRDRTYESIQASSGYQRLLDGDRPTLPLESSTLVQKCPLSQQVFVSPSPRFLGLKTLLARIDQKAWAVDINKMDSNGFLPMYERFNPTTYYRQYPRVRGLYDADYQNFSLIGEQTEAFKNLLNHTQQHQIPLVFVNLPLTQIYLDPVRKRAEAKFRVFMEQQAQNTDFIFLDQGNQWLNNHEYFTDPSHLNRYGAAAISQQLATNSQIPW